MAMIQGYVLLVLIVLISGSLADQHLLPAPENISMVSINLKHFLHWNPVIVPGNVTYSVQSQGEYEALYEKHIWHEIENCQEISAHHCNVTDEVFASVLYKFRVRSILGTQLSDWAELDPPFNRKTTILIPPKVVLQVSELNLVAKIEDYGPYFQYFVCYWQKGNKDAMKCEKTSSTSPLLEKAEEGKEYCAEVIAHAISINKNSSSSDTVCVQVTVEPKQSGLFIGLLCVFGVVVVFVPIALAIWKSASVMRYFCCPDEDIPDGLKEPYVGQKMLQSYHSSNSNSEEINNTDFHDNMLFQENSSSTALMLKF